jgi:hypothetical protein
MSVLKLNQIQTASGVIMANLNSSGANAGIQLASNLAPAFSAYASTNTTITNSTWTKVAINTENFDTNNNFDSTTNYRFTPTIAGYYQINFTCTTVASNNNGYWHYGAVYKNGSNYISATSVFPSGDIQNFTNNLSQVIYMNGSSDYLEFYVNVYAASGTVLYGGGSTTTLASGYLARSA